MPTTDDEPSSHEQKIKRDFDTKVAAYNNELAKWIDRHRTDAMAITVAMLESAIDQFLAMHNDDEASTNESITKAITRVFTQRRGTLQ